MYAAFSKFIVVLIILATAATGVVSFVDHNWPFLAPNMRGTFTVCFVLLLIPALASIHYLSDPVEREWHKNGLKSDQYYTDIVSPLLLRAGISHPVKVGIYNSADVNAFAISSIWPRTSLVAFSSGISSVMDEAQIQAIAAHEVAHLKNLDSVNKAFILAMHRIIQTYPEIISIFAREVLRGVGPLVIKVVAIAVALGFLFRGSRGAFDALAAGGKSVALMAFWPVSAIFAAFLLHHLLAALYLRYSRGREFVADAVGASLTSPEAMMEALDKLSGGKVEKVSVFDTHPPINQRILRLKRHPLE